MSNDPLPDYELEDLRVVTAPPEVRALADPLRGTILELLLERAATVGELAVAVGRPRSTVAYHVGVMADAGLIRVVRTRKVRAIDERFYGRTARIFYIGILDWPAGETPPPVCVNELSTAAQEAAPAHVADTVRTIIRHARIPPEHAAEFWRRVFALTHEFMQLPRSGDAVYAFVAGLYPTDHPSLPDPK